MLVIEVEYLGGRVASTAFNDRGRAEWPPHPARLYSALVATTAQEHPPTAEERAALEWLAQAPPPAIRATHASPRAVHTHYVPVNDAAVVTHGPIENALGKLRSLEEEIAATNSESVLLRLRKKRATLRRKLESVARQQAARPPKVTLRGTPADHKHLSILPQYRTRQPRTFPVVIPEDCRVYWVWNVTPPPPHLATLGRMVRRLVRLGHSSSLIRARVLHSLPPGIAPNWLPTDDNSEHPDRFIRVPLTDQLQRLEQNYARHQATAPRVLPFHWQCYHHVTGESESAEDVTIIKQQIYPTTDWIVFQRTDGPPGRRDTLHHLPATRCVDLAARLREALLQAADSADIELPEAVSGHTRNRRPSSAPHLAILPLPYAGSRYADGRIRGVALLLPQHCDRATRNTLLQTIGAWERQARLSPALRPLNDDLEIPILPVHLGRDGVFHLTRLTAPANLRTLQPGRWSQPAHTWCSVTPVALDRNPGNLRSTNLNQQQRALGRAVAALRRACHHRELPEPQEVEVDFAPPLSGVEPAGAFPPFPRQQGPGKPRRVLVHAVLHFAEPVEGPIFIGAGRYYGLGLFLPVPGPVTNRNA